MTFRHLLIFCIPVVIAADLYLFGWITALLRQASDSAVVLGVLLLSLLLGANYLLLRFFAGAFRR